MLSWRRHGFFWKLTYIKYERISAILHPNHNAIVKLRVSLQYSVGSMLWIPTYQNCSKRNFKRNKYLKYVLFIDSTHNKQNWNKNNTYFQNTGNGPKQFMAYISPKFHIYCIKKLCYQYCTKRIYFKHCYWIFNTLWKLAYVRIRTIEPSEYCKLTLS